MTKPNRVIVPMNVNILGAHNELLPTNPPPISFPVSYRRQGKPIRIQRIYIDPDLNIAKDTPLNPPYQTYPDSFDRVQGASNNNTN